MGDEVEPLEEEVEDLSWAEVAHLGKSYMRIPFALLMVEAFYWFITQPKNTLGPIQVSVAWVWHKLTNLFYGDGASSQGAVSEALNFAAVYKAPVVFVCENNGWAISTPTEKQANSEHFAKRGIAFDVPSIRVDGNDFLAVWGATAWAAERARGGHGPTLIEMYTYRTEAHSSSDDPSRYRPGDEPEAWPLGDPLERLREHMMDLGIWSDQEHEALEAEANEEVIAAYKEAEEHGTHAEGPHPPISTLFEDVYVELPPHLIEQQDEVEH